MLDDQPFATTWVESRIAPAPAANGPSDGAPPEGDRPRIDRWTSVARRTCRRRSDDDAARPTTSAADRLPRPPGAEPRPRRLTLARRRQRAYALLARHGFDSDTATRAIRRSEASTGVPPDPGRATTKGEVGRAARP